MRKMPALLSEELVLMLLPAHSLVLLLRRRVCIHRLWQKLPAFMEWLAPALTWIAWIGSTSAVAPCSFTAKGLELQFCCWYGGGMYPHANYEGRNSSVRRERETLMLLLRARKRLYLTYASTRGLTALFRPCVLWERFLQEHVKLCGVGSAGFWSWLGKRGDRHGTFGSGRGSIPQ